MEAFLFLIDSFLSSGIPIRSTLDATVTQQYAALIKSLSDKARAAIREIDPTNELVFFRLRTKKHEILIAPGAVCSQLFSSTSLRLLRFRQGIHHDRLTRHRCSINASNRFLFIPLGIGSISFCVLTWREKETDARSGRSSNPRHTSSEYFSHFRLKVVRWRWWWEVQQGKRKSIVTSLKEGKKASINQSCVEEKLECCHHTVIWSSENSIHSMLSVMRTSSDATKNWLMIDQVDPSSFRTIVLRKRTGQSTFGLYLADDYPQGIYIVTIEPNSPAAEAKIAPGDRLLAVNGQWVRYLSNNPKETILQLATRSRSLTVTIQPSDLLEWLRLLNETTYSPPKVLLEGDFERWRHFFVSIRKRVFSLSL